MYIFRIVLHFSKIKLFLSLIILNLSEKKLEDRYEKAISSVGMTILITRKRIVFGTCHGVEV